MRKQASKVIDGREVVVTVVEVDIRRRPTCAGCYNRVKDDQALLVRTGYAVRTWCPRCAPEWARAMVKMR